MGRYSRRLGRLEASRRAIAAPSQTWQPDAIQALGSRFANTNLERSLAYTSNVTLGDFICVCLSGVSSGLGPPTFSVRDNQNNTYVQAGSYVTFSNTSLSMWCTQASATGILTVFFTPNVACTAAISLTSYSGTWTPGSAATSSSASAKWWNVGPIPVSGNNRLVVAAFANNNVGNQFTFYGGGAFEVDPLNNSVNCGIYVADLKAAAPVIFTGTNGNLDNYVGLGVSFTQGAAITPPSTWQPFGQRFGLALPDPVIPETPRRFPSWLLPTTIVTPLTFPLSKTWKDKLPDPEPIHSPRDMNDVLRTSTAPLVQHNDARFAQSTSARTLAFGSNVTVNDMLVVCVATREPVAGQEDVTVTDSQGNLYHLAASSNNSSSKTVLSVWYTTATATGANTVTSTLASPGTSSFQSIAILEYSALAGFLEVDGVVANSGSASRFYSPPGPNVSIPNDIVLSAYTYLDSGNNLTAQNGFKLECNPAGATTLGIYVSDVRSSYRIVPAAITSAGSVQYINISVSLLYQASIPPSALWFPTTNRGTPTLPEPLPIHQPRFLAAPFLAAFSQPTSPWPHPLGRKGTDGPPPPLPIHQPRLTPLSALTGGVNPNPTAWVSYARQTTAGPQEIPPIQGLTEPSRRGIPFVLPGFTKGVAKNAFVPWDHSEGRPISRRHQQLTAQILNTLIAVGDLEHDPGTPQAPWRLAYNAADDTDWTGATPVNLQEALDRIAAALAALGQKP